MGWTVYVCYHVFPRASSVLSVIYDFRGEWTSVVSCFWLFWADLVWVGHKASGDLKIHGYSLTCTSASALEEHLHLLKDGVQFLHKDTLSHRERMHSVYSLPHNAENPSLKGGLKRSLVGLSTCIKTCIKYIVKFHVSNILEITNQPQLQNHWHGLFCYRTVSAGKPCPKYPCWPSRPSMPQGHPNDMGTPTDWRALPRHRSCPGTVRGV